MSDQDELVTRHQAARAAGVSYNTILLWIRAGRLHPVVQPVQGRPCIRRSELVGVMRNVLAAESSALWVSKRRPQSETGAIEAG